MKPSRITITDHTTGLQTPVGLGLFTLKTYEKYEPVTYYDGQLITHDLASEMTSTPGGKSALLHVTNETVCNGAYCRTGDQFANDNRGRVNTIVTKGATKRAGKRG